MIKRIIPILFIICISLSCGKEDKDDNLYPGNEIISGIAFYKNNITGNGLKNTLPNTNIYACVSCDIEHGEFEVKATSKSDGSFSFSDLANNSYRVYTTFKDSEGIQYIYNSNIQPGSKDADVILEPDSKRNRGLIVQTRDTLGGLLNNIKVCVFTSRILADSGNCVGSIQDMRTNSYARAFFNNIAEGYYYLRVKDSINSFHLTGIRDSVFVSGTGIDTISLILEIF